MEQRTNEATGFILVVAADSPLLLLTLPQRNEQLLR
jgi:hypothetical protein